MSILRAEPARSLQPPPATHAARRQGLPKQLLLLKSHPRSLLRDRISEEQPREAHCPRLRAARGRRGKAAWGMLSVSQCPAPARVLVLEVKAGKWLPPSPSQKKKRIRDSLI